MARLHMFGLGLEPRWLLNRLKVKRFHFVSSAIDFGPGKGGDAKCEGKQVQEWETGHGSGEMLDRDLEESLGNHRFSG